MFEWAVIIIALYCLPTVFGWIWGIISPILALIAIMFIKIYEDLSKATLNDYLNGILFVGAIGLFFFFYIKILIKLEKRKVS